MKNIPYPDVVYIYCVMHINNNLNNNNVLCQEKYKIMYNRVSLIEVIDNISNNKEFYAKSRF